MHSRYAYTPNKVWPIGLKNKFFNVYAKGYQKEFNL
jgi:hypothetical protein